MSFEEHAARRGFTILELLLTLIAVRFPHRLPHICCPTCRFTKAFENAARLLVGDLRLAQARASCMHAPVEVLYHSDGGGYQVQDLASVNAPGEDAVRRYNRDAIFEDVRVVHTILGPGRTLVFDADGRPASDGSITLTFRGDSRTVLVRAQDAAVFLAGASR